MAIDLQNPQNIETGWRGPTQFQAPSGIGEILKNRLSQQEFQQKQIADAIKQYQSQRSDAAYIQAAQNAGVLPQGDYSGMSAKEASDLAQRIQDMTPDTDADNLKQAMANYYNRIPGRGGGGGGDGSDQEGPEIVEKDGIKYQVNRTSKSVTYRRLPGQWGPTRTEQENVAPSLPQQTVYPDDPAAAPQPSPADTGDTQPTIQPQPQGTPRPSSYASPDQIRIARARQAMDDPDATPAEKEQARRILAGE